ncbi:MAG TPA: PP2C family serine/threonine-protein phosphatase [Anaerolineaceae bacterium]|jgi:hypothetical protein|nr:PP2C family serine/threonine-protein phosphatase [Anaerolineaceae bacterium]HOR83689.1 PP2C family serine/threonine-protein phosphatase [Anaerolineaceae bacterium]HPL43489.1 PP2C family serine/threonine-protein phosphatase [Anaerolineaceae bacterium]HPY33136.1 PP2C family serine/threonine-protein phosphatase [Anaerolineaceae bacterium]
MIYAYGFSIPGFYHLSDNSVCQDAHCIRKIKPDLAVAAVADGLGSCEHSEIGSSLAVNISTEFCETNYREEMSDDEILGVIKDAFEAAYESCKQSAAEKDFPIESYDTTLDLVIYRAGQIYYGHSGDSGIIALTADGLFQPITEQQRDEMGYVFPLSFGKDYWKFGKVEKPVASVMLMTDGMLDTLFPFDIRERPPYIHVALARFFMDLSALKITVEGESQTQNRIYEFVANIDKDIVYDDKTVAVLLDSEVVAVPQPDEYYKEPDWARIKEEYHEKLRRIAYPHKSEEVEKT